MAVGLFLAALALAVGLAWFLAPAEHEVRLSLAVIMAIATLIPVVVAKASGRPINVAEPIYAVSLLYLVLFPLRTLYLVGHPEEMSRFSVNPYDPSLNRALAFALVAYLLIVVGYYSPIGQNAFKNLPVLKHNFSPTAAIPRVTLIFGIGFAVQMFLVLGVGRYFNSAADRFTYANSENLLIQLGQFYLYGICLAAMISVMDSKQRRGWSVVLLALMLAATLVLSLLYINKSGLIMAIAVLALTWHFRRRWVSPRVVLAAILILVLTFFPLITAQRSVARGLETTADLGAVERLEKSLAESVSQLVRGGAGDYFGSSWRSLMSRSNGIDSLAVIMSSHPSRFGFEYGKDYPLIPGMAYIPRAVWSSKQQPIEANFQNRYLCYQGGRTQISVTNLGDLYRNFSIWGVLVGAFLLGIIYRFTYVYFIERTNGSDVGVFLYIFVLLGLLLNVEQDIAPGYAQILKIIPILLGLSLVMRVRGAAGPSIRAATAGELQATR